MKPAISASSLLLLCLGCYLPATKGCIYLYGSRHEAPGGIHYSYGYLGLDWPEKFATCSGNHQSPIYISANTEFQRVKDADASQFNYGKLASTGDNIKILNNGHTVQVGLPADYKPNATVVAKGDPKTTTLIAKFSNASDSDQATRVRITPAQFHFHAHSEHVIDGKDYPLEMHIVNFVYNDTLPGCGATGCATVVGIMLELADDGEEGNPFIDAIFKAMPVNEGESSFLPTDAVLDFDDILPADNSYVTYEGSLTSPPCTEGILWHVLTTPMKITRDQLQQFELAAGGVQCIDNTTKVEPPASQLRDADIESFQVPEYTKDDVDNKQCRKLANGQNYRQLQDKMDRTIYFYPASAAISGAQNSNALTLQEYIMAAGTNGTSDGAAEPATSAAGVPAAAGLAVSLLLVLAAMLLA